MQLLERRIERYFQRNHRRHVFARELRVKIQRMRECFAGDTLPLATAEVIAVWNDLPNNTVDILPLSMKTGLAFLQAPPPTPTGFAFDTDDATSSESSFNDSHDNGWVFVDNLDAPAPDVVASRALGGSTTSDDSMSRCSYPDQCSDKQNTEDPFQPTDSNSPSPSSDHESHSSSGRASLTPVGFHNMVNQWYLDYRARGTDPFVESLIAFGVVSMGTAPLASRIAHAVIRRAAKMSYTEGKSLENAIRFSALVSFKKYWELNDAWMEMSPTPYGINIASFIGSLFDAKVSTARDVHLCLSFLLEGEKRFERLCAMHALLVQANDKLCKNRNLPALTQFKHGITSRDGESGEYLWITAPGSRMILNDILATIERWMVSQALRREQSRIPFSNCTIRNRAVGPRLRNGPVAVEPLVL